jgi:hypothetical protein
LQNDLGGYPGKNTISCPKGYSSGCNSGMEECEIQQDRTKVTIRWLRFMAEQARKTKN